MNLHRPPVFSQRHSLYSRTVQICVYPEVSLSAYVSSLGFFYALVDPLVSLNNDFRYGPISYGKIRIETIGIEREFSYLAGTANVHA